MNPPASPPAEPAAQVAPGVPRRWSYLDGNGERHPLKPGTLRPAPEIGAGFFAAEREDGALVVFHRRQVVEGEDAAA